MVLMALKSCSLGTKGLTVSRARQGEQGVHGDCRVSRSGRGEERTK